MCVFCSARFFVLARRFFAVTVRKVLLFEWYYISQKGPTVFFFSFNFRVSFVFSLGLSRSGFSDDDDILSAFFLPNTPPLSSFCCERESVSRPPHEDSLENAVRKQQLDFVLLRRFCSFLSSFLVVVVSSEGIDARDDIYIYPSSSSSSSSGCVYSFLYIERKRKRSQRRASSSLVFFRVFLKRKSSSLFFFENFFPFFCTQASI